MDCELIRTGFPAQPADTLTALAFVVAGAHLATRRRGTGPVVYGLLLAAVGATSFMMHGVGLDGLVESIAVISLALWIALWAGPGPTRSAVRVCAGATVAAGMLVWLAPDARHIATGVALGAGVLLLIRLRSSQLWIAFGVAAGAAAVYLLSRAGGPWCVPSSPLQGHGLWHLMMATALWLVGDALAARPASRQRTAKC